MNATGPRRRAVRGAAALGLCLLLLTACALAALSSARVILLEQRTAASQVHAIEAFEAAEAGLDWALAMLNDRHRIDDRCQPSPDPAAVSFRRRFLAQAPGSSVLVPTGLEASCTADEGGLWQCACGRDVGSAGAERPSFRVSFRASPHPGVVEVNALGCTAAQGDCADASDGRPDASARHGSAFALLSALPSPPRSTLGLRGELARLGPKALVRNQDPGAGLAVHAGGRVDAERVQVLGPPGTPAALLIADLDLRLAEADPARWFARHFGTDLATWSRLPGVERVHCAQDCGRALESLMAESDGLLAIHVDGDLTVPGPLALGSAARPVALVVSGALRIQGEFSLHGMLYAGALHWDQAGTPGVVNGAVLLDADLAGPGDFELARDPAVLERLMNESGGFVRVNGAWRDF